LLTELKSARSDLGEKYKPKNQAETLILLGAEALNVDFNGGSIAASLVRAEALTKWLLETGAMAQADSWKGVNTVTMTMSGMGKCDAWWNAIHGVRAQAQGGVDRSEGHLTWDEFRVYAAILSVTGQDQWGRCSREEITARAAGWVGKKKRQLAPDTEVERRRSAGLMLSDKAVRSIVNYLENSGRLAKARYGHRTVFFGVGITRDELWDKIRDMMKKRALAKSRVSTNRQIDLQRTKRVRDAIKRELSQREANG
jgi:hypothetical protein